jgi:hypothetical protein
MAVRVSALFIGRSFIPQKKNLVFISVKKLSKPLDLVRTEGSGKLKESFKQTP